MKGMSVRVPDELHARLLQVSHDRVVGVNLIINRAIEDFLDRLPPIEPVVRRLQ